MTFSSLALLVPVVLAADMSRAPAVPPMKAVALPARVEWKLPNGLTVVLVTDKRVPLVTAALAAPGGAATAAAEDAGLVDAMAELLTEGTATKTAKQIAEAAEAFGGVVSADAGPDAVVLRASALADRAESMFNLLAEVARQPSFPEKEVALRKANMKEELAASRAESDFLAGVAFYKRAFMGHPYAVTAPTDASIERVTRERVKAAWSRALTPAGAVLVVVGDLTPDAMRALASRHFGGWRGAPAPPNVPAAPAGKGGLFLVDRPNSSQVSFFLGNSAVREDHPSYFDLLVANQVLGGSFSARLMRDIREDKGYTYRIGSRLEHRRAASLLRIRTPVRNEVAADALEAVLGHLRKLREEEASAAELEQAKAFLAGSFARTLETQEGVAEAVLHLKLQRLPDDYYDSYVQRVQAVTGAAAKRAAATFIRPDELVIVAVGDAAQVKEKLAKLSKTPVALLNQDGD
jgi:zinc protease